MAEPSHHHTVAVAGAKTRLGGQVVALLEALPDVDRVLALDGADLVAPPPSALEGVTSLVHLDRQPCPDPEHALRARQRAQLVDAAIEAGIDHVVVVSSAAVYGAWADNPVPLTEEAPLRPNPEADYALEKVESERCWGRWAQDQEGATLAVLRPALVVGDPEEQWLAIALRAPTRWGVGNGDVPSQFVHVDDLAAAVATAVERRLDGVYNVAPEGWMEGSEVQTLVGTPLRPPVPSRWAAVLARWFWSRGLGGVVPGLVPYATHPWVVAADRLRAEGWQATQSCGDSLVDAYPVTTWARLGPKARREVTLAGGSAVAIGVPVAVVVLARHHWHHRHPVLAPRP
ncbi:MAG: NAD-dependent epimerase/dehydratase family protein [Acidimicrobiales bacterium]